jgi:hypothetical protein
MDSDGCQHAAQHQGGIAGCDAFDIIEIIKRRVEFTHTLAEREPESAIMNKSP